MEKDNLSNSETDVILDYQNLSLEEIIVEIKNLIETNNPLLVIKNVNDLKSIFYSKLSNEIKKNCENDEKSKELDRIESLFKTALNEFKDERKKIRDKKEREEKKNLVFKEKLLSEIDALLKEEESLKITFEKFKTIQKSWREVGHVPIAKSDHIWKSYNHKVELFYDFIKINNELRDIDFKKNYDQKIKICLQAEELFNEKSINKIHLKLQELHNYWKTIGPVKKELRDEVWDRFKKITKELNKKRNDFFLTKKKEDLVKFNQKKTICNDIDKLSSSINPTHESWQDATKKCQDLEVKWKEIGKLNFENNKKSWKIFRKSLSNFYNSKNLFYKLRKNENQKKLEKKLNLCIEVEALKDSKDWKETSKKIINLQKEWSKIGYTFSNNSKDVWKRFNNTCNHFFKEKNKYFKEQQKIKNKKLNTKLNILERLKSLEIDKKTKDDTIKILKRYTKEWIHVGQVTGGDKAMNNDFTKLTKQLYKKIGVDSKIIEKEAFIDKIELLKNNKSAILDEKKSLIQKIQLIEDEIIQYENNISFFKTNQDTAKLLQETNQKIINLKNKIEDYKKKIDAINNL